MKLAGHAHAVARIFLVAGLAAATIAAPAPAQKPGGTLTVGPGLYIPGFDPPQVGVFDTSAQPPAAAIFYT
ncbi:ABC transporter substrate-binding protein, partial [Pandoraea nosoerga]|nr:ABC transporter substrate-binding protein [Pandoraea nosoerga]